LLAHERE
jgi:hypothetical protein